MIKVLRVSTHPTNLHKSVGYQSQMVSINDNLETIFVAPIVTLGDDYINHFIKNKNKFRKNTVGFL